LVAASESVGRFGDVRNGIAAGEETVGNLRDLALEAGGGRGVGAGRRMGDEGGEVAILPSGKGEESLKGRGHVAAAGEEDERNLEKDERR
jgi:hypothetical protein